MKKTKTNFPSYRNQTQGLEYFLPLARLGKPIFFCSAVSSRVFFNSIKLMWNQLLRLLCKFVCIIIGERKRDKLEKAIFPFLHITLSRAHTNTHTHSSLCNIISILPYILPTVFFLKYIRCVAIFVSAFALYCQYELSPNNYRNSSYK